MLRASWFPVESGISFRVRQCAEGELRLRRMNGRCIACRTDRLQIIVGQGVGIAAFHIKDDLRQPGIRLKPLEIKCLCQLFLDSICMCYPKISRSFIMTGRPQGTALAK